ncbi:MAG: DUF4249 domain-containing protein [Saprospiraceae bacterium]
MSKFKDRQGSIKSIFCMLACLVMLLSCETEFIPLNINTDPEIVVEGYIEQGEGAIPPYLLLTNSKPFFTTLSPNQLDSLFIHNADVVITDGVNSVKLNEICFNDLPPATKKLLAENLGINPDSVKVNICAYIDLLGAIKPAENHSYSLKINVNGKTVEAVTTIPPYVPLDSLWWREAPGKPSDTLLQLYSKIKDPNDQVNFYRFFCGINNGPLRTPFNSVFDDVLINGKDFEFRLIKPREPGEEFDQKTFGLFHTGDSISIKWACIDESHFNFWNTLEFNKSNQGPFSTYTTINSNIKGGLGIWGGYSSRIYKLKVKR